MIDVRMLLKELALVDELKNATDGIIRLREILEGNRRMWGKFLDSTMLEVFRMHRHPLLEALAQNEHMLGQTRTLEQKAHFNLEYVSPSIS
jgi:hypothetical protein